MRNENQRQRQNHRRATGAVAPTGFFTVIPDIILFLLTPIILLTSCYPVYDGPLDLSEQQSVWQYLSVFSIYHERLPKNAGDLTPEAMFRVINDTLKGSYYTGYVTYGSGASAYFSGESAVGGDALIRITDSTMYYRISDFYDVALGNFKSWRRDTALINIPYIVIDLRGNPGGSIPIADTIIAEFIPINSEYISTRYRDLDYSRNVGKTVEWQPIRNTRSPSLGGKKISVIMNGHSASCSEILIAGLKDCAGAHLVGERSYGKGIGQIIAPRMGRQALSITFMQIRGVPGGEISKRLEYGEYHGIGIPPDPVPPDLAEEVRALNPIDPDLYVAVRLLERLADTEGIENAARAIRPLLRTTVRRPEGYIVAEEDILSDLQYPRD